MVFEHDVFRTDGDPAPYLREVRRGMLAPLSPALQEHMRLQMIRSLTKRMTQPLGEATRRLLWEGRGMTGGERAQ